jgi:integrase
VANIANSRVQKFCQQIALDSKSTAREYRWRLGSFDSFLREAYNIDIDSFFDSKYDIYDVVGRYHLYLKEGGLSPSTISTKISTVKTFLEYNDVYISNTVFRLKVRAPRHTKHVELQALSKEMVRKILLEIQDLRLQSYVLLLAATGMRATEGLSVRLRDIDWDRKIITIRAQYTKTKRQRYVYLTEECFKHLKSWKEYRERERRIVGLDRKVRKAIRKFSENDLIFTSGRFEDVENPWRLYNTFLKKFEKMMDHVGLAGGRHDNLGARRQITLHSFRRFVKSTISDLGYQDYSEWFIGHSGSTYYRKTEAEKLNIFKKVEPYLTYLDYSQLEAKGADTETKLEQSEKEIESLKQEVSRLKSKDNDLIKELADRLDYLESKLGTRD